jgi:hypothetical protein
MLRAIPTIAFALVLAGFCRAQGADPASSNADLALVLAVDTSGSVDARRFELQKQGYVAAFRNARVQSAITSGKAGAIAVTMTQ